MNSIEIIKSKLFRLKELDKGFAIFGSGRHRYELNPTLTEEGIAQIEKENGIALSEEYKMVLVNYGNGGAGCGYGLEKLNLKNINPAFIGSKELLRNWDDPSKIDEEMVDIDEISGYIKLFDFGCGMEDCLIVKGEEIGSIIYFDCDERFQKLDNANILHMIDSWLDDGLEVLERVQEKLNTFQLKEVVDSEWELQNFSVKEMILSIMDAEPIRGSHSGNDMKIHLEREYQFWLNRKEKSNRSWWKFW